MREKKAYRENLEMMLEHFGKEVVTVEEVARWAHKDKRTVKTKLKSIITPMGISVASLANFYSEVSI